MILLLVVFLACWSTVEGFPVGSVARRAQITALRASTQQQATTDASRLKRIASLEQWEKQCDIKRSGIGIDKSSGGLGLVARNKVPANTVAVAVPSSIALVVETPAGGPDDSSVARELMETRKVLREAPWFAQFAVYLYKLRKVSSQKNGVDMQPWLNSLPSSFDTPLHCGDEEKKELQYNHLVQAVERQEVEWKQLYDTLLAAGTPALSKMTFDDFCWGCECARSRAFSSGFTGSAFNPLIYAFTLLLVTGFVGLQLGTLEQAANGAALVVCASIFKDFVLPKLSKTRRYVICPIIDMANHKSMAVSADVSFEFFGDAYSLATSKAISSGDEVFISYGARSNDQLLQYYGFVEQDNPHDVYVMPPLREWDIGALEKACGRTFSPGRLEKLDRAGLLGSTTTNEETEGSSANPLGGVVITRAGGVDPAVLQALRALVSTDQEWSDAGQAIGNFATEFSAENERVARLAARTAIEMELSSKPTTLEKDEALLKSSIDADRLAIEFRIEKKKLLLETLKSLN